MGETELIKKALYECLDGDQYDIRTLHVYEENGKKKFTIYRNPAYKGELEISNITGSIEYDGVIKFGRDKGYLDKKGYDGYRIKVNDDGTYTIQNESRLYNTEVFQADYSNDGKMISCSEVSREANKGHCYAFNSMFKDTKMPHDSFHLFNNDVVYVAELLGQERLNNSESISDKVEVRAWVNNQCVKGEFYIEPGHSLNNAITMAKNDPEFQEQIQNAMSARHI